MSLPEYPLEYDIIHYGAPTEDLQQDPTLQTKTLYVKPFTMVTEYGNYKSSSTDEISLIDRETCAVFVPEWIREFINPNNGKYIKSEKLSEQLLVMRDELKNKLWATCKTTQAWVKPK